jgi:predicted site-specific integrase-resolvase
MIMKAVGEAKTESGRTVKGNFVSLRDVATRVKVHHGTILRWVKDKKVNVSGYKNHMGHWVFREEDIAKFEEYKRSVKEAI